MKGGGGFEGGRKRDPPVNRPGVTRTSENTRENRGREISRPSLIESARKFRKLFAGGRAAGRGGGGARVNAILRLYFQRNYDLLPPVLLGDLGRRCRCESYTCEAERRVVHARASPIDPPRSYRGYVRLLMLPLGQSAPDTFTLPTYECLMRRR